MELVKQSLTRRNRPDMAVASLTPDGGVAGRKRPFTGSPKRLKRTGVRIRTPCRFCRISKQAVCRNNGANVLQNKTIYIINLSLD